MTVDMVFDAVVLRHRWWVYIDRPESTLLAANGNRFTAHSLVRIAKAYAVRRGLALPDGEAKEALSTRLSEQMVDFSGSLVERAKRLDEIADAISRHTHKRQISAVSKFVWFVHPDDWTMYDSRARQALGVSDHHAFYDKLDTLGFSSSAAKIADALQQYGLQDMAAGRVIDSYLLLRSAGDPASDHELAGAYLASLPEPAQKKLQTAAADISGRIAQDDLITEVRLWPSPQNPKTSTPCAIRIGASTIPRPKWRRSSSRARNCLVSG